MQIGSLDSPYMPGETSLPDRQLVETLDCLVVRALKDERTYRYYQMYYLPATKLIIMLQNDGKDLINIKYCFLQQNNIC